MLFESVLPGDTGGVIGLIIRFVSVPPEDTVGVIGLTQMSESCLAAEAILSQGVARGCPDLPLTYFMLFLFSRKSY